MAREDPQLKLRLTEELKARVTEAARANNRSVNAEIVARLQRTLAQDEASLDFDYISGLPEGSDLEREFEIVIGKAVRSVLEKHGVHAVDLGERKSDE